MADNVYVIQDNFLVYGKSTEELNQISDNILSVVENVEYRPFSAEVVGNPCFEVGDGINLKTKNQDVQSYIMSRTLKGIQGLRDDYSAEGDEYRNEKVNGVQTDIIQLKGKTNTLERNVEMTRQTITNVEAGLQNQITQTAESLAIEITNTEDRLQTSIEQTADSITQEVSQTYTTKTEAGEVEEELSSRIEQTVKSISLTVNNGDTTAGIVITLENEDGSTEDLTGTIELTGLVSFTDLEGDGTTVINGSNITTGKISCDLLDGGTIKGQVIEGGEINGSTITGVDIAASSEFKMEVWDNGLYVGYEPVLTTKVIGHSIDIAGGVLEVLNPMVIGNEYAHPTFKQIPVYDDGSTIYNFPYCRREYETGEIINYFMLTSKDDGTRYIHCQGSGSAYGIALFESDKKLKKNMKTSDVAALDKIKRIEFVGYDWKNRKGHVELGVSADQLEEVIPNAVFEINQNGNGEHETLKNVDNNVLSIYSLKAIQEQQKIIEKQQKEIDELKKSVSFLMQEIENLKGQ